MDAEHLLLTMFSYQLLLVVGIAACVGALVQSSVGFGLGVVAAPVITVADPSLMPASLLVVSTVLPLLTLVREWRHIDFPGLGWALLGRLPGTICGVWLIAAFPGRGMEAVVAMTVLVAVGISLLPVDVPRTRLTLSVAGGVAAVTATTAAIGGPPMALIYQRAGGAKLRATLSAFFVVGAAGSLSMLQLANHLERRSVIGGLLMLPFVAVGFALAAPLRRRLDSGRIRPAVLAIAACAATALLVKALLVKAAT
ncbi:sulfite exporter TauE/SafE family protein [Micromonospora sp. WMMD558]|uniref:sulfite exporter TauE/SafE family protein n=1 Tax=unclassified Micromonospora TaxID=2617518 RepID=UPI001E58239A|nr:sulfite exporter TauE/SafE family protein [Micromonospora sp. WMMC415]